MKIHPAPIIRSGVPFNGNWLLKLDKTIGKIIEPKPVLTQKSMELVDAVENLAKKHYDPTANVPLRLNVKNGNKEFSFSYNTTAWHRITVTKKGEELCDFEVFHVRGDKDYNFYSTGGYPSVIIDKKFIDKYNTVLEDWMPRLLKRYEKLDKNKSL